MRVLMRRDRPKSSRAKRAIQEYRCLAVSIVECGAPSAFVFVGVGPSENSSVFSCIPPTEPNPSTGSFYVRGTTPKNVLPVTIG